MNYTYAELHLHTAEISGCAEVSGAEAVNLFKENGYDLVCVTDHYKYTTFWEFNERGNASWKERADYFMGGYRAAKAEGDRIGLTVLFGCEITFNNCPNDYLVFGLTEEMFYEYPEIYTWTVEKFSEFARKNNIFFAQAHPFRNERMIRTDPRLIDGCEAYNTADNDIPASYMWAKENGLIITGGQDYHCYDNMRGLKTAFYGEVKDIDTLTKKLFNKEFDLIITPNS